MTKNIPFGSSLRILLTFTAIRLSIVLETDFRAFGSSTLYQIKEVSSYLRPSCVLIICSGEILGPVRLGIRIAVRPFSWSLHIINILHSFRANGIAHRSILLNRKLTFFSPCTTRFGALDGAAFITVLALLFSSSPSSASSRSISVLTCVVQFTRCSYPASDFQCGVSPEDYVFRVWSIFLV